MTARDNISHNEVSITLVLTGSVYHSFLEGRRKFDQEKWKVPIKMFYCERDPIKKDLVVVLPFILILI